MITDNTLNVAMLQFDIAWLDAEDNFKRIENLLLQHSFESTELLLLPETFSSGFAVEVADSGEDYNQSAPGPTLQWMIDKAKVLNLVIAGSVLTKTGSKKANRFFWVWPNGDYQYYDKKHLFTLAKEDMFITAGTIRKIIKIKNFRILPQVCYDLRFPIWNRNLGDYDLLVNVANWPEPRRDHWSSLLKARAIENLSFVIGVNRIGVDGKGNKHNGGTAAFAFDGKEIVAANDNQSCVMFCSLSKEPLKEYKEKLPFYKDADNFKILE